MAGFIRINKAAFRTLKQLIRNRFRQRLIIIIFGVFILACLTHLLANCNSCISVLIQKQVTLTRSQVEPWSLFAEQSLPSWILYLIEISVVLLFFMLAYFYKKKYCFFFCILYGAVFVDDFLMFHERFGRVLSKNFDLPIYFNIREQAIGELLASLSIAIFLSFFIKLFRGLSIKDYIFSILLSYSFGLLIFFGFFLDFVVGMISYGKARAVVASIEDGGEFLSLAITFILVSCMYHRSFLRSKHE